MSKRTIQPLLSAHKIPGSTWSSFGLPQYNMNSVFFCPFLILTILTCIIFPVTLDKAKQKTNHQDIRQHLVGRTGTQSLSSGMELVLWEEGCWRPQAGGSKGSNSNTPFKVGVTCSWTHIIQHTMFPWISFKWISTPQRWEMVF